MKKILITGASSGIGRELAQQLAAGGHALAVSGRDETRLAAVPGVALAADLTQSQAAERLVPAAAAALGGLDVVVHSVGAGLIQPTLDTTDAAFTRVMNVNARTAFLLAREACRWFSAQKSGLFITIPGILGKAAMRNAAAYCASKYAVTGLVKSLALEFQRSGVRFCLFHFGGVDTPFWDEVGMAVQRDKLIPVGVAAGMIVQAIEAPGHLVLSEMVLQPESHQLV
jgi:NAD(P)-dependent dehydrogenase (short-subunit alcohol dehydrogenase family)